MPDATTPEDPRQPASPEVVERLVRGHRDFLAFLESRVRDRAVAEDLLQAAFVKALERGGAIHDAESAVAWFYRLLRNAIIDHYRQNASGERVADELTHHLETHQEPDELTKGEICQCVNGLLDAMKPEYQEALRLVDLEEGSLNQLAAQADISANNAAVRVHRAREALRKKVTVTCGMCATHGCLDCHCSKK